MDTEELKKKLKELVDRWRDRGGKTPCRPGQANQLHICAKELEEVINGKC